MRRHRPPTVLATVLGLLVAATTLVAAPGAPAEAAPPTLPNPNSFGLTVVSGPTAVSGKPDQYDITLRTAAIFTPRTTPTTPSNVSVPVKVRVLLPAGYDPDRAQPYDVLYLLHGGMGTYADWSTKGDVAGNIPGFDGIVVMPEGGRSGWYSDWPGHTDGGFAPLWETFHIHQLVPWVDANFNTSGTRSGRAIAGLSMGGYGALRYAGRYPHLFSAVGAFSAGTDINPPGAQETVSNSMWVFGATIENTGLLDGHFRVNPPWFSGIDPVQYRLEAVFGPRSSWPSINPMDLAPAYNAFDGRMAVYAGGLAGWGGETDIGTWNLAFHQRLQQAGVDHRWCGGQGSHDWTWWKRHLRDFVAYAYGTTPSSCPN